MPATHSNAGISACMYVAVKGDAKITTFSEALEFLNRHEPSLSVGTEVLIGKRTKTLKLRVLEMDKEPTKIGLVLYDTVIVVYYKNGTYTTNSGGYLTPTTCTRLKQFTPIGNYFAVGNRQLLNNGYYADKHVNVFAGNEVVGVVTPVPCLKRKSSKTPHGTLRWMTDDSGMIYSTNSKYRDELVHPVILFDQIGKDGDFTGEIPYGLIRSNVTSQEMAGLRGIQKLSVPLNIVNAHRALWKMPEIVVA